MPTPNWLGSMLCLGAKYQQSWRKGTKGVAVPNDCFLVYGCVLKWWVFPISTPGADHFLWGKPWLLETHHFRKPSYSSCLYWRKWDQTEYISNYHHSLRNFDPWIWSPFSILVSIIPYKQQKTTKVYFISSIGHFTEANRLRSLRFFAGMSTSSTNHHRFLSRPTTTLPSKVGLFVRGQSLHGSEIRRATLGM